MKVNDTYGVVDQTKIETPMRNRNLLCCYSMHIENYRFIDFYYLIVSVIVINFKLLVFTLANSDQFLLMMLSTISL